MRPENPLEKQSPWGFELAIQWSLPLIFPSLSYLKDVKRQVWQIGSVSQVPISEGERSMIKLLIGSLELLISKFYRNRSYPRFYVLETVARVPYFAYLSVLHLYETIGFWRQADLLKIHFAESWNELHHLLIMESLGGNQYWIDRFVAQHLAMIYYWITIALYIVSPSTAYRFSELVERHAYETYDSFLKSHGAELKELPAPMIAVRYYHAGDLYMFDEFQTSHLPAERRPVIHSLYDVFVAIREDEMEHVKTMVACQEPNQKAMLSSPHTQISEAA